jgi:hypothetical protein
LGGVQLSRATATLAVIGFSQVGQLEINREGLGDPMGLLDTQRLNNIASLLNLIAARLRPGAVRAGLNEQSPELLYGLKNRLTRLVHQDPAQQNAQGTNVAAEGGFLRAVIGRRSKLRQSLRLVFCSPQ